jgi:hypothetical protein
MIGGIIKLGLLVLFVASVVLVIVALSGIIVVGWVKGLILGIGLTLLLITLIVFSALFD